MKTIPISLFTFCKAENVLAGEWSSMPGGLIQYTPNGWHQGFKVQGKTKIVTYILGGRKLDDEGEFLYDVFLAVENGALNPDLPDIHLFND